MKLNKAIKIATESMRLEIKKIAFDANMYDKGMADYILAKNRSERKKMLCEAIEELSKLVSK